ncbi:DNA repair exonuclease [Elioraea sp. Yellowstone]|uniref:metallophosphoesterase family protein n=1 Tax=Elioraea sp. Yellowstone TaxID=2592070 RepID=UPI0011543FA8|nr:metallophosphoesterase [Elioraea sp. Yellowstone]TQF76407.1 DNA repair exonuclease [Elioraea sp. Yellowstone]
MPLRFLHCSDLQIGRSFAFAPPDKATLLAEARIDALDRLAAAARRCGAPRLLVAGDVFDGIQLSDHTLDRALARMAAAGDLVWHLLPGNHDPHRPGGLWERLGRKGWPANVRAHLAAEPVSLDPAPGEPPAVLLPTPFSHRRVPGDPTAWMDSAATPEGALRIGLAHGAVVQFGPADSPQANLVSRDRAAAARLDYLALGDWHRTIRVGPATWYSGTPEPDTFDVDPEGDGTRCQGGYALAVEIEGRSATPRVSRVLTGRFVWHCAEPVLAEAAEIDALAERFEAMPEAGDIMLRLAPRGALTLAGRAHFRDRVEERLAARLRWLDLDLAGLEVRPEDEDLAAIDLEGAVRIAADRLAARARNPADPAAATARRALVELWLMRGLAR